MRSQRTDAYCFQRPAPFLRAAQLQPSMSKGFNSRYVYGVWDKGKVTVYDCWRNKKKAVFTIFPAIRTEHDLKLMPRLWIKTNGEFTNSESAMEVHGGPTIK